MGSGHPKSWQFFSCPSTPSQKEERESVISSPTQSIDGAMVIAQEGDIL